MCGLAGIISNEKHSLNKNHFNILGCCNDERGGDSCGTYIDGTVSYGVNHNKLYRTFMCNNNLPNAASIALLHCRKTSVRYVTSLAQAQPIIIKKNNNIEFVLMHNGTINNIDQLAKQYLPNFQTTSLSDTQILAQIIYEKGYDILSEYTGTAVLSIVDYRSGSPEVFLFKGSSAYNEKDTNCERPLYYSIIDNKFYFSSLKFSLYCIDCTAKIEEFPTNVLCRINNTGYQVVKTINRSKIKTVIYSNIYSNTLYSNHYCAVTFDKKLDLYQFNQIPVSGKRTLYCSGYECFTDKSLYHSTVEDYYFYNGRLLCNKECYDLIKDIENKFGNDTLAIVSEVVDYLSYNPIRIKDHYFRVDDDFNYYFVSNDYWVELFNKPTKLEIKNGIKTESSAYPYEAYNIFKNTNNRTFDRENIKKKMIEYISININRLND